MGEMCTLVTGELSLLSLYVFYGKIRIRLMNRFHLLLGRRGFVSFSPFFGGDDLAGATVLFTSATRVVVPTDRETDGTDVASL